MNKIKLKKPHVILMDLKNPSRSSEIKLILGGMFQTGTIYGDPWAASFFILG